MAHEADDMDTPTIAIVGLIAAGATFAAIYLIMWLYYYVANRQETANIADPYKDADRTMAEQQAILNEVGWIDQNTGQMRIPVSTAMDLVVDQLRQTPEDAGVDPEQFRGVDATNVGGAMNASGGDGAAGDGAAGDGRRGRRRGGRRVRRRAEGAVRRRRCGRGCGPECGGHRRGRRGGSAGRFRRRMRRRRLSGRQRAG